MRLRILQEHYLSTVIHPEKKHLSVNNLFSGKKYPLWHREIEAQYQRARNPDYRYAVEALVVKNLVRRSPNQYVQAEDLYLAGGYSVNVRISRRNAVLSGYVFVAPQMVRAQSKDAYAIYLFKSSVISITETPHLVFIKTSDMAPRGNTRELKEFAILEFGVR